MLAAYSPTVAGQKSRSSPGNIGDGIAIAESVNAAFSFRDGYIGTTAIPDVGYRDPINKRFNNVLAVTAEGSRFVNEAVDYPLYHRAMTDTGSGAFFQIFDAGLQPEGLDNALASGAAFQGATLEERAASAGSDAAALTATVNRYNELCEAGGDADFGKSADKLLSIGEPPFYALKIAPVTIGSIGGVKINVNAQVLDENGAEIPGFFAAGAVANGDFFYQTYPASGTSICMSFTFGRTAGTNAAAFALK